jgi:hypothetical protein
LGAIYLNVDQLAKFAFSLQPSASAQARTLEMRESVRRAARWLPASKSGVTVRLMSSTVISATLSLASGLACLKSDRSHPDSVL